MAARLGDTEMCALFHSHQQINPEKFVVVHSNSTNSLPIPIDIKSPRKKEKENLEQTKFCKSETDVLNFKQEMHRFCSLNLLKGRNCSFCSAKIVGQCFACSVCNITVHEGICRRETLFSTVCAASVPQQKRNKIYSISPLSPLSAIIQEKFSKSPEILPCFGLCKLFSLNY